MYKIKDYVMITLGTLLIALEVYFFEIPNSFTIGGVSGISVLLGELTQISTSNLIVFLNIILLIIGFIFLGRSCGIKTIYCSLLYSAFMKLFETMIPLESAVTDEPFLELIFVIILTSIGSALIFRCDATSGGTDIIALIIKKYSSIDVGKCLLFVDFVIVISAFFVFDIKTGLYSLLGLFARAFLVDSVIENMDSCKYFTIVTTEAEKLNDYIIKTLGRGATVVRAYGAYTGDDKTMLLTACGRAEAVRLQKVIHSLDPLAFVVITTSSEIIGSGFRQV